MLAVLLFLSILQIVCCSCPNGFQLVQNECRGNYSRVASIGGTDAVNQAIAQCGGILAQPIIIHNSEQQSYWIKQVSSSDLWYAVIGLVCNFNTKNWEWTDGSALDFKPGSYSSALNETCTTYYNGDVSWMMTHDGTWTFYGSTAWTTDVFCVAPNRQPLPAADGCESFEDDSEDGVCYQVGAAAENWQEAQLICRSFGAEVASIHNEKENSFIRRLAVSKGAVNGVFLGAAVNGKGDDFGWLDGSEWNYDNFYPGFPHKGFGDCLIMDTGSTSGDWVNVDCSTKLAVACVRKQHYTQPSCSSELPVEGQIIYSPGFPFDASSPCDFILSVETGKKVQVEIFILEANPCCDHLILYENYFGSNVIANLTGQITDTKYATSSTNFMRVSWQPNGGVNVRGLMMTYRAL